MDLTPVDYLAPVFAQYPIEVMDAHGVWLKTRDGRRILDLYGGHAVAALGYGHPGWTAALAAQAAACNFQSNAVPMAVRTRAAARLVRFSQLPFASVFFVNSGAEANENALKLAFRITGREKIAAVEGSFHGRTAAAGAITWGARAKWFGFPAHAVRRELYPAARCQSHRRACARGHCGRHCRARAGRRRRLRHGRRIPGGVAPPLRRDRRAAHL